MESGFQPLRSENGNTIIKKLQAGSGITVKSGDVLVETGGYLTHADNTTDAGASTYIADIRTEAPAAGNPDLDVSVQRTDNNTQFVVQGAIAATQAQEGTTCGLDVTGVQADQANTAVGLVKILKASTYNGLARLEVQFV